MGDWMKKVTTLYALIEEFKDGEGIASTIIGGHMVPMVFSNMAAPETKQRALEIFTQLKLQGNKVRLAKYQEITGPITFD